MPPLPSISGVLKCEFSLTDGFRGCSWGIHIGDASGLGFTLGDVSGIATALNSWQNAHEVGLHPTSVSTAGVKVTDLSSPTAPEDTTNAPTAGTSGSKSLPLNVALVEKIPIPRRYRGGHGHVFIPFISDQFDYTGENWHSTDITAFDGIFADLITTISGLTSSHGLPFTLGVLSYFTAHAERGTPLFQPATNFQTQPRVCSRRRRLPKISG